MKIALIAILIALAMKGCAASEAQIEREEKLGKHSFSMVATVFRELP